MTATATTALAAARADGRALEALRPVTLTRGFTAHAEGSVLVLSLIHI